MGKSVTITFGIGLAMLPAMLAGGVCLTIAYMSHSASGTWVFGRIGLLLVVGAIVTSQILGMVARSALYEYATESRRVAPFTE